jgi:hypothetical protein
MKGKSTISEVDNLGTTHYQRLDTKPCISHERSKIDMGKNTWAVQSLVRLGARVFGPIYILGLSWHMHGLISNHW